MTGCWSEGELRAWLDGELPAREMELVALHLQQCTACNGLHQELAGRAARVGALMDSFPETPPVRSLPPIPRPSRVAWQWIAAATGLAASLVFALVLAPRHSSVLPAKPPQAVLKTAPPPVELSLPLPAKPPAVRHRPLAKPKPRVEDYVALDNEPIEAGVVVRVQLDAGLNGAPVPADVILGPDGRARAIRLVSDISGER